jgi:hypothetical protein
MHLSVDIGNADSVGINESDKTDTRTDQTFGTPAANTPYSKNNNLLLVNLIHLLFPEQKLSTLKYPFVCSHI